MKKHTHTHIPTHANRTTTRKHTTIVGSIRAATQTRTKYFLINLFAFISHPHPDDELANAITEAEAKAPEDLTEHDKMALLGRPKAGDVVRAQLRIKESKEFKVSVSRYLHEFRLEMRHILAPI